MWWDWGNHPKDDLCVIFSPWVFHKNEHVGLGDFKTLKKMAIGMFCFSFGFSWGFLISPPTKINKKMLHNRWRTDRDFQPGEITKLSQRQILTSNIREFNQDRCYPSDVFLNTKKKIMGHLHAQELLFFNQQVANSGIEPRKTRPKTTLVQTTKHTEFWGFRQFQFLAQ